MNLEPQSPGPDKRARAGHGRDHHEPPRVVTLVDWSDFDTTAT